MKLKIAIATIVGCAALAACGGNSAEDNAVNADTSLDMNTTTTDMNMGTDMNAGTTDMNAGTTDVNGTTDMNATANSMDNTSTTNTTNSL
jgi:ABC-type glycerol-3-phosphate transport system substrate-binding protein